MSVLTSGLCVRVPSAPGAQLSVTEHLSLQGSAEMLGHPDVRVLPGQVTQCVIIVGFATTITGDAFRG